MQTRLERFDVNKWGQDFTKKLHSTKEEQKKFSAKLLDAATREKMIRDYDTSQNRILFLDYDGTLSPFKARPETAVPERTLLAVFKPPQEDQGNNLEIIRDRNGTPFKDGFGHSSLGIVPEHGA